MRIIKIECSPRLNKRFRVLVEHNGEIKHYDFGDPRATTFIDGASKEKRNSYILRHLGNTRENYLVCNIIPSPALFAYFLLWTDSSLYDNIDKLNILFKDKYK